MLPSRRHNCPWPHFDLVRVATALRWIAPEARFAKSHALLKASGHLAIIHRHYVSDEQGDAFTAATQPIYQRYARDAVAGARTYLPRCIGELEPEPIHEELFAGSVVQHIPASRDLPGGG
jgi:hypothetical protein